MRSSSVSGLDRADRRRADFPFDGGGVDGGAAAPQQRLAVHVDRRAVEFDGRVEAGFGDRHPALLPRVAEQEQVGGDGVAHQRGGQLVGVEEIAAGAADGFGDGRLHLLEGELPVGVAGEIRGGGFAQLTTPRVRRRPSWPAHRRWR
jgi:hypothetical protein